MSFLAPSNIASSSQPLRNARSARAIASAAADAQRYTVWESGGWIAGVVSLGSTDFILSVRGRVIRNGHTARREQLSPADNAPAWLDTVSFQGGQNRARVPLLPGVHRCAPRPTAHARGSRAHGADWPAAGASLGVTVPVAV